MVNMQWVVGFVASLAVGVGGCVKLSPELEGGSGTEDGESTTLGATASSGSTAGSGETGSSGTGALDDSTTAEPTSCHDQRPIPPSRFDCSGADGVSPLSVIIEGGDDPSILAGVRRVEGSIIINRTDVTNLDFMGCVEEVTGDVVIYGNDALTNVDGLWSLRSIEHDFIFSSNDALTDFDGLPHVETLRGTLLVQENAALEVITGFHRLGGLLDDPDYDWGSDPGGDLSIQRNPVLRSMDGLGRLMVLQGVFAVTQNPSLCMSSVECVGTGIVEPATPPNDWSTVANDNGC